MSELNEKVHELTRDYRTTIYREAGDGEVVDYVQMLSLLNQLESALFMQGTGAGTGGAKSPMKLEALDIKVEIDRVSAEFASPKLPVPVRIQTWAQEATGDEQREFECLAWVAYWTAQINALFESSIELERPCPECGVQDYLEQDESNPDNAIHKLALVATTSRALCRHCHMVWEGHEGLLFLSSQI